jgi:hypothetical protein
MHSRAAVTNLTDVLPGNLCAGHDPDPSKPGDLAQPDHVDPFSGAWHFPADQPLHARHRSRAAGLVQTSKQG